MALGAVMDGKMGKEYRAGCALGARYSAGRGEKRLGPAAGALATVEPLGRADAELRLKTVAAATNWQPRSLYRAGTCARCICVASQRTLLVPCCLPKALSGR